MSKLVQVQTLRGNAGPAAALAAVEAAVATYNAANPSANHVVASFVALPPNVKGMQVQLSLLAVLARSAGSTLIRLNVHNGNVALCGPADAVAEVQAHAVETYNAMVTLASRTYNPAVHGGRMGFTNGFLCGYCAGMDTTATVLAYGLGTLFPFPAPGTGEAYALGMAAAEQANKGTVKPPVVRTTRTNRKSA